jgi:hypothetical protein
VIVTFLLVTPEDTMVGFQADTMKDIMEGIMEVNLWGDTFQIAEPTRAFIALKTALQLTSSLKKHMLIVFVGHHSNNHHGSHHHHHHHHSDDTAFPSFIPGLPANVPYYTKQSRYRRASREKERLENDPHYQEQREQRRRVKAALRRQKEEAKQKEKNAKLQRRNIDGQQGWWSKTWARIRTWVAFNSMNCDRHVERNWLRENRRYILRE